MSFCRSALTSALRASGFTGGPQPSGSGISYYSPAISVRERSATRGRRAGATVFETVSAKKLCPLSWSIWRGSGESNGRTVTDERARGSVQADILCRRKARHWAAVAAVSRPRFIYSAIRMESLCVSTCQVGRPAIFLMRSRCLIRFKSQAARGTTSQALSLAIGG